MRSDVKPRALYDNCKSKSRLTAGADDSRIGEPTLAINNNSLRPDSLRLSAISGPIPHRSGARDRSDF